MNDRIEKIYEAEKSAVQKRDALAAQQKEQLDMAKKNFAAEKEAALAAAEAEVSRRLAEAKKTSAESVEKAKTEALARAEAAVREAQARVDLASDFIIREIFEA